MVALCSDAGLALRLNYYSSAHLKAAPSLTISTCPSWSTSISTENIEPEKNPVKAQFSCVWLRPNFGACKIWGLAFSKTSTAHFTLGTGAGWLHCCPAVSWATSLLSRAVYLYIWSTFNLVDKLETQVVSIGLFLLFVDLTHAPFKIFYGYNRERLYQLWLAVWWKLIGRWISRTN